MQSKKRDAPTPIGWIGILIIGGVIGFIAWPVIDQGDASPVLLIVALIVGWGIALLGWGAIAASGDKQDTEKAAREFFERKNREAAADDETRR